MSGNSEHVDPLDEFTGVLQPSGGRALEVVSSQRSDLILPPGSHTPSATSGIPGPAAWLRALRRRWFLALSLGLTGAVALGVPAWLLLGADYVASATLLVRAYPPSIAFEPDTRVTLQDFEVYKRSQQQLVKSRFVLIRALGRRDIASLELVRSQPDPVAWLQDSLEVSFPGNAEILEISLRGEDPEAIARIINSVVDTYLNEVVYAETKKRQEKLKNLENVMLDKSGRLERLRRELEREARSQASADSTVLGLKQQIKLQQFSQLQRKLTEIDFRIMEEQNQLQATEAIVKARGAPTISEFDLENLLRQDPTIAPLEARVTELRDQYERESQRLSKPRFSQVKPLLEEAEKSLEEQRNKIREQILKRQQEQYEQELSAAIEAARTRINVLTAQRDTLQKRVNQLLQEAEVIGQSTVGIEMKKSEIAQLDQLVSQLRNEIERLNVEIKAPSRIESFEKAEVPKTRDMMKTIQVTAFLSMLGLAVPVLGISWLEVRARRIHTTSDVVEGLGIRVIGVVPSLKAYSRSRAVRNGTSPETYWNGVLRESVDGVRTLLLRQAPTETARIVLVTSAMAGEGKTSLASQLAMSFARAGRKTLLVDGDFRKPGAHLAFSLPLEPGLCDVLRGDRMLAEGIRPTRVEHLWLLPAGQMDPQALSALSQGALGECFEDLKQEYDFIIVDGAPVLPVVDTMIMAQYVDYAVLSVLCDVSQSPRVYSAAEKLSEIGVHVIGAVVSAVPEDVYSLAQRPLVDHEAAPEPDASAA